MVTRVTVTFRDIYGVSAIFRFHVPGSILDPNDPTVQAIVAAANALCRAVAFSIELSTVSTYSGTAGTGAAVTIDKALAVTKDTNDDNHIFRVPAPKVVSGGNTVFLADGVTLDLADAAVIAWSNAIVAAALSQTGDALSPIREGHRTAGKRLKN